MLRPLLATLLSSILVLGNASTAALSAPAQSAAPQKNESPLAPGRAAGIKQAQGMQVDPLLAGGIVAGIFIVGALLIGDDDDDDDRGPPTTGTN
jgi:hypothetical protein